jgi:hypothetical protein
MALEKYLLLQKLPKVNPDFARKLMEAKEEAAAGNKKKAKVRYVVLKFNICLFYFDLQLLYTPLVS